MTSPFTDAFLRFIPDLDSWFLVRLNLSEIIVDRSLEQLPTVSRDFTKLSNEARELSADFVARFEKAISTHASAHDFVDLAYVAIHVLGDANLNQERHELANRLIDKMIPTLLSQGSIDKDIECVQPNRTAISGLHYFLSGNFRKIGYLLESAGKIEEAENFYKAALEAAFKSTNSLFDLDFSFQAIIDFYISLLRFSEAEAICKQWIEAEENEWGRNDNFVLFPLDKLSEIYLHAGKYKEAEQIFYRTLSIERTLQPNPSSQTLLKSNMAWAYKRLGRYTEADLLTKQAITEADEK